MGEVETVEHTRDRGVALTVYFGRRKGSASTADVRAEIDHDDDRAGLRDRALHRGRRVCRAADAARMATFFPDLDQWHPWALDATRAIELGIAAEAAGRALDPRLHNSDGASVSTGSSVALYANSHGFFGRESGTRHSISCSLFGEDDSGMQRDYWYTTACRPRRSGVRRSGRSSRRRTHAGTPVAAQDRDAGMCGAVRAGRGALADRASGRRGQRRRLVPTRVVPARRSGSRCSPTGSTSSNNRISSAARVLRRSTPKVSRPSIAN